VMFVTKKDQSLCMVVDYRLLNVVVWRINIPFPKYWYLVWSTSWC
jgi:hypothetical protein